jgi:hypothetical protein
MNFTSAKQSEEQKKYMWGDWIIWLTTKAKKAKAVPLHAMEALVREEV